MAISKNNKKSKVSKLEIAKEKQSKKVIKSVKSLNEKSSKSKATEIKKSKKKSKLINSLNQKQENSNSIKINNEIYPNNELNQFDPIKLIDSQIEIDFVKEKNKALPPKEKNNKEQISLDAKAIIQAALFVAGKEGMTLAELHKILPKLTMEEIRIHLKKLQNKFDSDLEIGISIKDFGNKYKLLTKPEIKKEMSRYANLKFKNPLNSKLMEVLAIIAYNQPCTRPRISEIRGVDSANLVDILIEHGLVQELGRSDTWGRPFIYAVTDKFFDLFGISSIEELPKIQNFDLDSFAEANFFDSNRFEE